MTLTLLSFTGWYVVVVVLALGGIGGGVSIIGSIQAQYLRIPESSLTEL
ncbi:MAG TPA: hypothetical protein LFW21_05615 [Rickettsia endosymbiont of Pyrocoelia pectoralis]|nr:hypothetical protein [Rickettsia endosymbiont of Pyrocoelia pectoralis]